MENEVILNINNPEQAKIILLKELQRRTVYKWRTKNGECINIKDMSDSHLLNVLNLIQNHLDIIENCSDVILN